MTYQTRRIARITSIGIAAATNHCPHCSRPNNITLRVDWTDTNGETGHTTGSSYNTHIRDLARRYARQRRHA